MPLNKVEEQGITEELEIKTNLDSGFNDLSDEQKKAIITLIVTKYC